MLPPALAEVLKSIEHEAVVVVDLRNALIQWLGAPEFPANSSLAKSLFGDMECAHCLDRSLESQILPREWGQGAMTCIVCKPTKTIIVGVFALRRKDAAEGFKWSKEVDKKIKACFTSPGQ